MVDQSDMFTFKNEGGEQEGVMGNGAKPKINIYKDQSSQSEDGFDQEEEDNQA